MGCLLVLVALISPRLALFFTWAFTDRLAIAFDGWFLPVLGWFLLPWTTLVWTFAYEPRDGVTGIGWFFVVFAFLVDLGLLGGAGKARRQAD
ncbi:MAG TPA: hypothetical protein VIY72_16195 [Acidimicrobiales bacterium]